MEINKIISTAVVLFIISVIIVPSASAQSFSISLHPEKHEIISRPGQTITLPYSLSNLGDPQLMTFKIYSLKINGGHSELGEYKNDENTPEFSIINSAIELGKPFLMNGKSTVLFDVQISVPENAPRKDYYTTLVAESEGLKGSDGMSAIQLEGGAGSHILLTVTDTGQIVQTAKITEFTIPDVPVFTIRGEKYYVMTTNNSIPFKITIANTGNNYFKTKGRIQSGSANPITLPETTILSRTERTIKSKNISEPLLPRSAIGLEKITATIQIAEAQVLYTNANIIVIPLRILILIGMTLLVIACIYIFMKTRKNTLRI